MHVAVKTDNGADAGRLIVAERPHLVLIQQALSILADWDVVREHRCSPATVRSAQPAEAHARRLSLNEHVELTDRWLGGRPPVGRVLSP